MARFVFELQAALDQRQREERSRQLVVAQLQREATELEEGIGATQVQILRERQALREALGAERAGREVDLDAARRQGAASLAKIREAQQAAIRLAGVFKRLDAARLDLLEAARHRKAVELLRDRRYEQWKRQQNRREIAEVDELTVMRAGRAPEAGAEASPEARREARGDAA